MFDYMKYKAKPSESFEQAQERLKELNSEQKDVLQDDKKDSSIILTKEKQKK